jgi:hypothetical protein
MLTDFFKGKEVVTNTTNQVIINTTEERTNTATKTNTNKQVQNTNTSVPQEPAAPKTGFIEGSLSYPSEQIPPETVCAENISTGKETCTDDRINDTKYQYGVGYKLEVPAGNYHVYAKVEGLDQKSYYSEFVTCGLDISCTSHDPITVTVTNGKTTTGVDPQDWYNY